MSLNLQSTAEIMPRRESFLQVATFLLSAVISLAVYNVKESLGALKELLNTRIDHIEKRLDRHETIQDNYNEKIRQNSSSN